MTKKVILMSIFALTISSSAIINAQVGINTENPKATLDIVGKPSNPAIIDGIIAPRLTGKQLAAKDAIYGAEQTGTVVYALDASAAAGTAGAKTTNVTAAGYYYFDGTVWRALQGTSGGGSSSNFNFSYNPTTNVLILEDGTKTETITLGVSASNGLTETNKDIQLGGTLIKNTEIAQNGKNLYTTGSGKVSVGAVPASSSAKFEVNGASANTQAYNAGSGTNIDFTLSNLAYTNASAGAFSVSGLKDGGTYTLAVKGIISGTASFTQAGITFHLVNNSATTADKHTLYTFVVMGNDAYVWMTKGF